MNQVKDVQVTVIVRNNRILSRMRERGITSVGALSTALGYKSLNATLYLLINMKMKARLKDDSWHPLALKMAVLFQCLPEDLFSEEQQWSKLERNRAHAEVTYAEVALLTQNTSRPRLELETEAQSTKRILTKVLLTLTPREERIIRMRFGINGEEMTLQQIGDQLGVHLQRVREIEAKALRKMKHPAHAKRIMGACGKIERTKDGTRFIFDDDVLAAL